MTLHEACGPTVDAMPAPTPSPRFYTVTELARELGVTARALRFYEDKGLLSPSRAGSTRVYTARDRARLILILRGKRLGFSLRGIKDYLDLYDVDPRHEEQTRALLAAVGIRITALEDQLRALTQTLTELREVQHQAKAALIAPTNHRAGGSGGSGFAPPSLAFSGDPK